MKNGRGRTRSRLLHSANVGSEENRRLFEAEVEVAFFLLGIERLVRVHVCAGPSLYCLLKRRERADKSPALLSLSPSPLSPPLFIKGSFTAGHSQGQKEEEN